MKIGQLASRTGCPVQTIRYYEQAGLLTAAVRSGGNYRLYTESHVERVTFIRNCRALDMTLGEVRALLHVKDRGGADCGDVDALLDAHIAHVAARIDELRSLQRQLMQLRDACGRNGDVAQCAILQGLTEPQQDDSAPAVECRNHLAGAHR